MLNKTVIFCSLILVGFGILFGCTHPRVQGSPTNTSNNGSTNNPCDPDSVYFNQDILPLVLSNCAMSGCHNTLDHADGIILTDYASIMSYGEIKPFNPNSSDLYEAVTENDPDKRMPYNLPALSTAQIELIKKWIEQGALQNTCSDCDTTGTMSYSIDIQPLLQSNCTGCHSGSVPQGNIDLSSYAAVSSYVTNGKLAGAIQHQSGFSAMPKGGSKLSTCDITTILKWINDGAQNN